MNVVVGVLGEEGAVAGELVLEFDFHVGAAGVAVVAGGVGEGYDEVVDGALAVVIRALRGPGVAGQRKRDCMVAAWANFVPILARSPVIEWQAAQAVLK